MTKPFIPPPRPDLVTEQLLFDIEMEKMTPEQFNKGIAGLKALMDARHPPEISTGTKGRNDAATRRGRPS